MPLLPFRLHSLTCPFRAQGRAYNRCKCAIWVDGSIHARRVLKSLKTRDWQKAQKLCRDMEESGAADLKIDSKRLSIADCTLQYEAELRARKITQRTIGGYQTILKTLQAFCADVGIHDLKQFDLSLLERYRQTWDVNGISGSRMLGRLRNFFAYAVDHKWIDTNIAKKLRPPKQKQSPTLPFSKEEMKSLLAACGERSDQPLKALILLMRYSGLRISDASSLAKDRLSGDRLFLYTAKTGTPVFCILPQLVLDILSSIDSVSPRYWFWDGSHGQLADDSLETLTHKWRWRFHQAADLAKIPNAHPHRLRDTFAISLLQSSVPMEDVSKLLGHTSITVTEKHYAPWVRGRQEKLEEGLRRALKADGLLSDSQSATCIKSDIAVISISVNDRKKTG